MTKSDLMQYRAIRREAVQLREQIERLEAVMTAPPVQQFTGMPSGGAREGSRTDELVARHDELLTLYRDKLRLLTDAQLAVERAIDVLDPIERRLMRLRYLDGLRWEAVCVEMSYSWRRVHQIHAQALGKIIEAGE